MGGFGAWAIRGRQEGRLKARAQRISASGTVSRSLGPFHGLGQTRPIIQENLPY